MDWTKFTFTDESKSNLFEPEEKRRVCLGINEDYKGLAVKPTVDIGGDSVAMWAGTINGPGPICRINGIMNLC